MGGKSQHDQLSFRRSATHIYPGSEVVDDHVDNFVLLVLLHRFNAHFPPGHTYVNA